MEEILRTVTGQGWSVRLEVRAEVGRNGHAPTPAADGEPAGRTPAAAKEAVLQHPLVQKLQQRLGATLLEVPEGFDLAQTPAPPRRTDEET